MINRKFGKLTVISEHSVTRNSHTRYTCKCECGKETNVLGTHLRQGTTVSCGCANKRGSDRLDWKGCGEISGAFWKHHIVRSADGDKGRRNPVEICITIDDGWKLFLMQNRSCALTGLSLTFPKKFNDKSWTASLDRIDSTKGYICGNVQWVHKDINMMKRIYTQAHFIHMCKLVAEHSAAGCEVK